LPTPERLKLHLQREWQARRLATDPRERRAIARTLHALDGVARRPAGPDGVIAPIMGFPMRGSSGRTLHFLFNDVFLSGAYRFDCDRSAPTVVDCGANIGFATLYFKRAFPAATVHCFEANPDAFRFLEENVRENNLSDVHLYPSALWNHDGAIEFFVNDVAGTLRASVRADRGGGTSLTVKATRLSHLLSGLDRVDAVKVDVEGAEHEILDDLVSSGLLARPERYLIEYHHQIGGERPRLADFLRPFEEAGYRYHVAATMRHSDRFQDILIHATRV
jgi:FkbM family methyltransferase